MKKLKILFVFGFLATLASGCADNTYNPNTQLGYRNMSPFGYNNPNGYNQFNSPFVHNNGTFNPFITNYPNYVQASPGIRFQWGIQAGWMWGLNTPGMFYNTSSNCSYRVLRYPVYTPDHCSCYRAPCNCARILARLHHHHRTSYDPPPATHPSSGGNQESNKKNTNPPPVSGIVLEGEIARALMIRLEKPWDHIDGTGNGVWKKQGLNYVCSTDNIGTKTEPPAINEAMKPDTNYKCQFYFDLTDKKALNQQNVSSLPGQAIQPTRTGQISLNNGVFLIPATAPFNEVAYEIAIVKLASSPALNLEAAFGISPKLNGNDQIAYGDNYTITQNPDKTYTLEVYLNTATGDALEFDPAQSAWKVSADEGKNFKSCSYDAATSNWSCK